MEHQIDSTIQKTTTMNSLNRRNFLKRSLLGAATVSFSARSWSQVAGANSAIRSAVVGFNGRGGSHINGLGGLSAQGVRMVGLCDVDSNVLQGGVSKLDKAGTRVDGYTDIRKLLERKDIDVISIATPNHWHALATIWSVQAGKDVYVEKPVCHNVWEGRKMVEAARKYKKIVQTGTQCRSSSGIREAVQWVQGGNLGKITAARGLCYKPRGSIGKVEQDQPIPESINYDLWCGPAPMDPLRRARLHYDWHWIWNYGNGDLGNQGIHQMDIARWFLGENDLSPKVMSVGGRLGYVDDGETPNTQFVYHEYDSAPLIFEVRGLPRHARGPGVTQPRARALQGRHRAVQVAGAHQGFGPRRARLIGQQGRHLRPLEQRERLLCVADGRFVERAGHADGGVPGLALLRRLQHLLGALLLGRDARVEHVDEQLRARVHGQDGGGGAAVGGELGAAGADGGLEGLEVAAGDGRFPLGDQGLDARLLLPLRPEEGPDAGQQDQGDEEGAEAGLALLRGDVRVVVNHGRRP